MDSGTQPPDRPSDQPGSGPPEEPPREPGPQSPAPGPQSPAPGPQSPGPQSPGPEGPPQSPAPVQPGPAPPAGPSGPEGPPAYTGPVPPGGWQTPAPAAQQGWAGGVPLASWGSRVGATLLDWLILLIPAIVLTVIIIGIASASDSGAIVTGILGFLAYFIASLFYAPLLMARGGERNGQTLGKQIVGIRAVRDAGRPFELGSAFVRELAVKQLLFNFVGGFFFSIPTLLDWLWPLWDDQNRALHDMVVSTHVVRA